jgi:hypothetical protein
MLERNDPSETVWFADTPSPFATVRPVPTVISRAVTVLAPVLTWMPFPEEFKLCAAPVKLTCKVPCAPLSVKDNPLPAAKEREFANDGCWVAVKNVCVCVGWTAIALVVVWTVTPF